MRRRSKCLRRLLWTQASSEALSSEKACFTYSPIALSRLHALCVSVCVCVCVCVCVRACVWGHQVGDIAMEQLAAPGVSAVHVNLTPHPKILHATLKCLDTFALMPRAWVCTYVFLSRHTYTHRHRHRHRQTDRHTANLCVGAGLRKLDAAATRRCQYIYCTKSLERSTPYLDVVNKFY